ncbi:MAG: type IV toxin-antitoxin system AbiEi family antitoxin domain-containing protein [Actinomycetota bacterium]|nr:type IV toxin-antitoxin system AbiEi family antitoxin domain-containing protein [Actinomycetota bacterium]
MSELMYLASEGWTRAASVRGMGGALELIRHVAEAQGGVIDRTQLLACGLSSSGIARLIDKGWLMRLYPGVYALGHMAITERGRLVAPLLYGGAGSALSHFTAAYLWRLIAELPLLVCVSCPVKRRPHRGARFHSPKEISPVIHEGFPLTTVARTLLDIAAGCADHELRKALANAEYRGLLDSESLQSVMGRGHPGSAKLRRAIERHMPELAETLSPLEDMLLLLCERHGVPLPVPNARVGPFKPDGLWSEAMLIVEVDGGAAHSSPSQRRQDAERDMYFRGLGYLVLRYTYWQIKHQGDAVALEVRTALADRVVAPN